MSKLFTKVLYAGGALLAGLSIKAWVDKYVFHQDGFNNLGYNRQGFDRNGFDRHGYNSNGFDANGYNSDGFDLDGYDHDGYNRQKYDRNGRDRQGYDKKGFNAAGYDHNGYSKAGYNVVGIDRSGYDNTYYAKKLSEMRQYYESAQIQMKKQVFRYALQDIRTAIEMGVKCIIDHNKGHKYCDDNLNRNIEFCSRYALLDNDFIKNLDSARKHCNDALHDSNNSKKEHRQVFFTHKVLEELMVIIQKYVF